MKTRNLVILSLVAVVGLALATDSGRRIIHLSTSKFIQQPVPGEPRQMGGLPVTIAVSPDQKYAAVLEAGYGTVETEVHQSIAVLDFGTNEITRFADPRLGKAAKQTYFLGLAWSRDGKHLYAPMASISDPTGEKDQKNDVGNGIAVYAFDSGKLTPERFLKIPPQPLAAGKKRGTVHEKAPAGTLVPYPAGIAVVAREGGDQLLVANNLSDDALLMDAASGEVLKRFDLSTGDYVPSAYPYGVVVDATAGTAYVSLWNVPKIAVLDLNAGRVTRWIGIDGGQLSSGASAHPTAMALSNGGNTLFVTLSATDQVAVIDTKNGKANAYFSTKLPGQKYAGTYPNAVALDANSSKLYVANASSDAVAVYDLTRKLENGAAATGFIPTEWYPTALAVHENELLIATGKGEGPGRNNIEQPKSNPAGRRGGTYVATLLHGSLARVDLKQAESNLKQLTQEVLESNLMNGRTETFPFKGGRNPIKHVIYIIKENRTYDQILGDLGAGNGDKSLTMYGEEITPNQHALARRFGVLDNFYDSGEVSGNGHVWSNAAITSDYTEKTWQIGYRGGERMYDYEGMVSGDYPIKLGIPDVNEPGTGYLWTNLAKHGKTYRHFGEYISTHWCDRGGEEDNPQAGGTPLPMPETCTRAVVKPGEQLPANLGQPKGGPSPYPWNVPLPAKNIATKPELVGHFDPKYPDFRLEFPDQLRVDEFLNVFDQWVAERKNGKDTMPQFMQVRLPNDHTSGKRPGVATPEAAIADNDLAVGRVAEAISNSPYWDDTAIFIVEDDAQDGVDHVDAHRSIALVISKYSPGSVQSPFVDSNFYTTVNMIRTMEALLDLPPMNNNDAQAAIMAPLFSGDGTQPAYKADYRNRDNKRIYEVNPPTGPGAKQSAAMDFSHADAVDTAVLNRILWEDRMGKKPMPEPRHSVFPEGAAPKKDDDD